LESIFAEVKNVEVASFSNPSIARNNFTQEQDIRHKDELYYPMFKPENKDFWNGNLKRYRLDVSAGQPRILDWNDNEAYDGSSSTFKDSARSYWSTEKDGADITKGGVLSQLSDADNRKLFVLAENGYAINIDFASNHELKSSNSILINKMLDLKACDNKQECKVLLGSVPVSHR